MLTHWTVLWSRNSFYKVREIPEKILPFKQDSQEFTGREQSEVFTGH